MPVCSYCVTFVNGPNDIVAPQAHFDPVWGLAKWCVRCPFVTVACASGDFVCETSPKDFSEN